MRRLVLILLLVATFAALGCGRSNAEAEKAYAIAAAKGFNEFLQTCGQVSDLTDAGISGQNVDQLRAALAEVANKAVTLPEALDPPASMKDQHATLVQCYHEYGLSYELLAQVIESRDKALLSQAQAMAVKGMATADQWAEQMEPWMDAMEEVITTLD